MDFLQRSPPADSSAGKSLLAPEGFFIGNNHLHGVTHPHWRLSRDVHELARQFTGKFYVLHNQCGWNRKHHVLAPPYLTAGMDV